MLRTFVRNASKSVEIQLLQDIPNVGMRGEVMRVSAGYMRNYLQVGNRAAYIVPGQGPSIPVVKSAPKVVEKKEKKPAAPMETPVTAKKSVFNEGSAPTLADLTSLLQRNAKRVAKASLDTIKIDQSAAGDYLVADLADIPTKYTHTTSLPVPRKALADAILQFTGVVVPESQIRINHGTVVVDGDIQTAGEYTWTINCPTDQASVTKSLIIAEKKD